MLWGLFHRACLAAWNVKDEERMAKISLKPHVPLIRFLGPRHLLWGSEKASSSSSSVTLTRQAPSPLGPISVQVESLAELPPRYRPRPLTPLEMETIEVFTELRVCQDKWNWLSFVMRWNVCSSAARTGFLQEPKFTADEFCSNIWQ